MSCHTSPEPGPSKNTKTPPDLEVGTSPERGNRHAALLARHRRLKIIERAFRSRTTVNLHLRPIYHRIAQRVRAHIFLCTLAYYVEWHTWEVWRDRLFSALELEEITRTRDPAAPAERS